jgi:hypothetical protein
LNTVVDGGWSVDEAPLAQALAQLSSASWLQAGSHSAVWRMVPQEALPASGYARALLGTSVDQLPWRAVLSVRPARTLAPNPSATPATAARAWGLPLPWADSPPVVARLQFSLLARGQSQPAFEVSGEIALPRGTLDWQAPQLSPAARAQSAALAQQWTQRLTQQLLCEAVRPEVVHTQGTELRINAGALAGVRAGDEWLLADPRRFPHQVLESGVAAQTVLARVQRVHADHAQLQILAGQGNQVRAGWRAWAAEGPTVR